MVVQTYDNYSEIETLDITINIIFIMEFLIKAIAIGFFVDKNSYLRDSWNQLDFGIVLISILDFIL